MPPITNLPRQVGVSPSSQSYILDDSSPQITYTSFPTASVPSNCLSTSTCTYQNTVHQTSSSTGMATFTVTAGEVYIFGAKGPSYGSFGVVIDGVREEGSATADKVTTQTMIYSKTGLDPNKAHTIVLMNGQAGTLLALDFISTSIPNFVNTAVPAPLPGSGSTPGSDNAGPPATVVGPSGTVIVVTQTSMAPPTGGGYGYGYTPMASAGGAFGSSSPYGTENSTGNDKATGIGIGVAFAIICIIVSRSRLLLISSHGS